MQRLAAIVTGGASGIGAAAVQALAEDGAAVLILDAQASAAEKLARGLQAAGGVVDWVQADVTDARQVEAAVQKAVERFGGLDVLVNSAGIAPAGPITEFGEADFDRVIAIDLKGVWLCTRAAVPALRQSRCASVVNVASNAGLVGFADLSAYCAAKGGVVNLSRALAIELAPDIRVNCICPGHIETPMGDSFIQSQADPERFRLEHARKHPLQRLGRPDEIASVVRFLVSPSASYVTGAIISADAGYTAQ